MICSSEMFVTCSRGGSRESGCIPSICQTPIRHQEVWKMVNSTHSLVTGICELIGVIMIMFIFYIHYEYELPSSPVFNPWAKTWVWFNVHLNLTRPCYQIICIGVLSGCLLEYVWCCTLDIGVQDILMLLTQPERNFGTCQNTWCLMSVLSGCCSAGFQCFHPPDSGWWVVNSLRQRLTPRCVGGDPFDSNQCWSREPFTPYLYLTLSVCVSAVLKLFSFSFGQANVKMSLHV